MKPPLVLVRALLAVPVLSLAQTAPAPLAAVADPGTTVPATHYRPALDYSPRGVAQDSADWIGANAEVGRFTRGHSDILKWEQSQSVQTPTLTPTLSQREREQDRGDAGHGSRHPLPPGEGKP